MNRQASGIKDLWLYAHNIIRSSRLMINEDLKPLNLSSAEGNILIHLFTREEGVRQEEIVEQLDISKPAVSRALESLEQKGYVTRAKDPCDRRASHVLLTPKGLSIGPQVEEVYSNVYAIAAQGVAEAEIKSFIELFGRVSSNFTAARAVKKEPGRQNGVKRSLGYGYNDSLFSNSNCINSGFFKNNA